ncbi:hypothetical protein CPB83DRAFT_843968 [Crepidotus variabilis]|uniref:Uncharacterized protein n=1 Tax=Crepidotus variabilis TaxID=179855 RepID=A0A9P6JUH0_9AGAR|nr:hypothetical protein CPB83DRAFT_843968 [Crepidotus variabilis]
MQQKRSTMDQSYRPASQSTIIPSQSHRKRPSIQATMHWLSRSPTPGAGSTSSLPGSYSPSKPVKVQEPKPVRTIDLISSPPRSAGLLGTGATVVRTPDEALRETGVRLNHPGDGGNTSPSSPRKSGEKKERKEEKTPRPKHKRAPSRQALLSSPTSPPLPPLPLPEEDEERLLESDFVPTTPPRPTRSIPGSTPDMQRTVSKRSSMKIPKSISITNSTSTYDDPPSVPPLPAHIAASTQPPPFSPILVSEPPTPLADQSKAIISLETCTQTFRTTLATLSSRPSHLSKYLSTLFRTEEARSHVSSVYSTESEDMAMYRRHLTGQGLVPVSTTVHIFLDRPSSPYHHILAYLRTPYAEGQIETLPYALQLHSSPSSNLNNNSQPSFSLPPSSLSSHNSLSQTRLENLIEVRDEAAYLHLDGLHKLCTDEIRNRYGPRLAPHAHHTRGQSSSSVASIHSLHASVYSLHTLLEKVETDLRHSVVGASGPTGPSAMGGQELPITPATAVPAATHTPAIPPAPTPPPTTALPAVPGSASSAAPLTGPFAPPPAAIAIRRSKQLLNGHFHSHSNSTSTSSVEVMMPKTPPTPKSWEGSHHQEQPSKSPKTSSRSSSKSRPAQAPPAGWI